MGIKVKKEKKPRKTRDIANEYPKWPWVDYKFQDGKFFEEVKKLLIRDWIPKGRSLTSM